ncbi:GNAT family N-acetyltransferase [Aestuariispira insulae]|uniref:Acetyltransferase (GNAT) family protein n=1 Tax=Aestuariispira insulae TaxID=1461337 RepID=A0A3D9HWC9_9PROT|nr:GNAT family N-acetyltransferase [Aestuariispira insulae]RED53777.1 hypothetical protein DFP90_101576 [Aestuariispira insulae]
MTENKPEEILRARAAQALGNAFWEDPFFKAIMCDFVDHPEERACRMQRYFIFAIEEAFEIGRVDLDGEHQGGAAVWVTEQNQGRLASFRREKAAFLQDLLGPDGKGNYQSITGFMGDLAPDPGAGPLWYLSILGVDAVARGRGLAGQVLAPGLRAADLKGVPTYLETFNPVAERVYGRLGYELVSRTPEPVTGQDCLIMLRPPL